MLSMLAVTIGTSIANVYVQPVGLSSQQSLNWYKVGAVLAAGHLAFVPFVAPSVKAIFDGDGDANEYLDKWLWVNGVRGLTVDLAAWVTLGIAVAKIFGRTLRT